MRRDTDRTCAGRRPDPATSPSIRPGESGFARVTAALPLAIVAFASAASASPAPPGWREREWNQQFFEPIHLQARIVSTPVKGWKERDLDGPCEADAVALVSFRGADRIRTGQRFAFGGQCDGQWFSEWRTAPPFRAADPVGGVRRDDLVELFLDDDLLVSGYGLNEGLHEIRQATATPTVVRDRPPRGLNPRMLVETDKPSVALLNLESPVVIFPLRDETVLYRTSAAPGRTFAANFVAAAHAYVTRASGAAGRLPSLPG